MNTIAIIMARGGSKGLPRKNVKLLAGKPLIAYTIEHAIASGVCVEELRRRTLQNQPNTRLSC